MNLKERKIAFETLGCKLNFSETSAIRRSLEARGAVTVGNSADADIIVVNTCSVTDVAEKKARQLIRRLHRISPHALIAAVGCYAQLRAEELLALDGVVLAVGAEDKMHLADKLSDIAEGERRSYGCDIGYVESFSPAFSYGDRTRSFLKIQDGCDYRCSYCTIPYARGRSRSATIADVLESVRSVAAHGVREVILTGVNTGDFGRGNGETLLDLMRILDDDPDICRFRISSIEPNLLTEEIISFVGGSRKFMPHFHVPLQAGSDSVLRLMRRRYSTGFFADRIAAIRSCVPDAFIGVDVIAGMRGETDELFEEGKAFIESLDISRLHIFPYSERSGTPALDIPYTVSMWEKRRRTGELTAVSDAKLSAFMHRFAGTERPVLFESTNRNGKIEGFTDNYIRVAVPWRTELENSIASVTLDEGCFAAVADSLT